MGKIPPNKRIFSAEEEQYIRDHYNKVTVVVIATKLGLSEKTVRRTYKRLGLKCTKEEADLIMSLKRPVDHAKRAEKVRKIEGGTNGNYKARFHLSKWIKENGDFSYKKKILVYKTTVGNFDDLILISRKKFDSEFLRKRENRIVQLKKNEEKKKILDKKRAEDQKKAIAKAAVRNANAKKKEEADARQKKYDELKANSKPLNQLHKILLNEEKVRVRIDHRTTIFVKKSLCEQLQNGDWVKKKV